MLASPAFAPFEKHRNVRPFYNPTEDVPVLFQRRKRWRSEHFTPLLGLSTLVRIHLKKRKTCSIPPGILHVLRSRNERLIVGKRGRAQLIKPPLRRRKKGGRASRAPLGERLFAPHLIKVSAWPTEKLLLLFLSGGNVSLS